MNKIEIKKRILDISQMNNFLISDEKTSQMSEFINILLEWNSRINLTAHKQIDDIIEKDIIDALYLNMYIKKYIKLQGSIIDLACGAGFIGIVLSIISDDDYDTDTTSDTPLKIAFLDSNRKKMNFVKQVSRELKLQNTLCFEGKAEDVAEENKDKLSICVSRATWTLHDFLLLALNYVQIGGSILWMAGKNQNIDEQEIQDIQGLERGPEFVYTIKPKLYERKIISFIKK